MNEATQQILVAAYWLTDPSIINLLIAKKRRGKDVQIIMDESIYTTFDSINPEEHVNKFLNEGIEVFIYPSQEFKDAGMSIGLMHNKFAVIDGEHVFTGSANFTKSGLGAAEGERNNYENVVVIHDAAIAKKYVDAFEAIKNDISDLSSEESSLDSSKAESSEEESEESSLTEDQVQFLINKGYSEEEIKEIEQRASGMSPQERFNFLGSLPRKQYRFAY